MIEGNFILQGGPSDGQEISLSGFDPETELRGPFRLVKSTWRWPLYKMTDGKFCFTGRYIEEPAERVWHQCSCSLRHDRDVASIGAFYNDAALQPTPAELLFIHRNSNKLICHTCGGEVLLANVPKDLVSGVTANSIIRRLRALGYFSA